MSANLNFYCLCCFSYLNMDIVITLTYSSVKYVTPPPKLYFALVLKMSCDLSDIKSVKCFKGCSVKNEGKVKTKTSSSSFNDRSWDDDK